MHKATDNGGPYMMKNPAGNAHRLYSLRPLLNPACMFKLTNIFVLGIWLAFVFCIYVAGFIDSSFGIQTEAVFFDSGNEGSLHASGNAPKGGQAVKVQPIEVPLIPVEELKEITDNFGTNALIGEGSYGRVYYGVLKSGEHAAIKKLDASKQPDEEYLAQVCRRTSSLLLLSREVVKFHLSIDELLLQVSMVSRLKHDNFVQLLGYCVDGNSRVLAYEFASNGSLHDILHGM